MNDSNQLNKFGMSCSSILNQKGMQKYKTFSEITYFQLECQNYIKNIKECSICAPMSLMFLSKPLECNFVIKKTNLIVLINTSFFMKKNSRFYHQFQKNW
jgi:hypothetical protein